MSDSFRKVYSILKTSKNGTTVKSISKETGIAERTVYNCLKELRIQRRVYKDPKTGFYRNTPLPLRGYQPRRCHGLMHHYAEKVGQTVLQDFIGYVEETHPDFLIGRELKIKSNCHSTFNFKTTDRTLSPNDLETWGQANRSFFGNIDWTYSKFTYNIDNALCTLEPKAVTIQEAKRILRIYNHPYNGIPHLRFEVEKTKISHEEAVKMLLYQADVDYLLDIIFQKDRLIDALMIQLNRERIESQKKIEHLQKRIHNDYNLNTFKG